MDEQKNSLSRTDYTPIDGFDAVKYEELYTRALYKPAIADNKEKIMFVLLVIIIIGIGIGLFMIYKNSQGLTALWGRMGEVAESNKGIIIGAKTV